MTRACLCSSVVQEDLVLSLEQMEKKAEPSEEKSPEADVVKLFTKMEETGSPVSLYEQLKGQPEALTLLAPAAGDAIISLDFSCPGQCAPSSASRAQRGNQIQKSNRTRAGYAVVFDSNSFLCSTDLAWCI